MPETIYIDREGNEFSDHNWITPRYTRAAASFLAAKFDGVAQFAPETGRKPKEGECWGTSGYFPEGYIVRLRNWKGDYLANYLRRAIGQIMIADGDGLHDFPPMRDVETLTYHRKPTAGEKRLGHEAEMYRDFPIEECTKPDGDIKEWLKADDGLRYYR